MWLLDIGPFRNVFFVSLRMCLVGWLEGTPPRPLDVVVGSLCLSFLKGD